MDRNFKAGDVVILKGQGEVLLVHSSVNAEYVCWECRMHGPSKCSYWTFEDKIIRKASAADVLARRAEARVRGVDCNNPDCWCRRFDDV